MLTFLKEKIVAWKINSCLRISFSCMEIIYFHAWKSYIFMHGNHIFLCMEIIYFHAWKSYIFMHENDTCMHESENFDPGMIFPPQKFSCIKMKSLCYNLFMHETFRTGTERIVIGDAQCVSVFAIRRCCLFLLKIDTVLTNNSCTKCVGSPGIIHDRMPNRHPVSWALKHEWPHN